MNRKTILMSPADSKLYEYFKKHYNVICSEYLEDFISYERYHADMQAVNINGKIFVNAQCSNLITNLKTAKINYSECIGIGNKYPQNVALNVAFTGKYLICNRKALHPEIREFCEKSDIDIINTNQGYAKCSTLILNEDTIITDDVSIAKAADKNKLNVLKIDKDNIFLDKENCGFIGGAGAVIGKTVYFFGDIYSHKSAKEIIEFIRSYGLDCISVDSDRLRDIGGIVILSENQA